MSRSRYDNNADTYRGYRSPNTEGKKEVMNERGRAQKGVTHPLNSLLLLPFFFFTESERTWIFIYTLHLSYARTGKTRAGHTAKRTIHHTAPFRLSNFNCAVVKRAVSCQKLS